MKFDLDPTLPKVVIIAILLFLEALCIPIYAQLTTGTMPTDVQWLMYFFGAVLQLVTFLMAFIKGKDEDEKTW